MTLCKLREHGRFPQRQSWLHILATFWGSHSFPSQSLLLSTSILNNAYLHIQGYIDDAYSSIQQHIAIIRLCLELTLLHDLLHFYQLSFPKVDIVHCNIYITMICLCKHIQVCRAVNLSNLLYVIG